MTENFSDLPKPEKDIRLWASVAHFIPLVVLVGLVFANILAPALVWFFKRDHDSFIVRHAKESVNFQISITMYGVLFFLPLYFLLKNGVIPPSWNYGILVLITSCALVFVVMMFQAAVVAMRGEEHRYLFTIRFFQ